MCGCSVTPQLVERVRRIQRDKDSDPFRVSFTIVTSLGRYDIPPGETETKVTDVNDEFVALRLSRTDATAEDIEIRLCCVQAIESHFDKE